MLGTELERPVKLLRVQGQVQGQGQGHGQVQVQVHVQGAGAGGCISRSEISSCSAPSLQRTPSWTTS